MSLARWKPIMEDPKIYLATPAIQIFLALRVALSQLKDEGLELRWERHRALGSTVRKRLGELGVDFVAESGSRADTVTAFWVEDGKAGNVQKVLEATHHIVVAKGIGDTREKMIRIGHFGVLTLERLRSAMDPIEQVLLAEGVAVRKGTPLQTKP